jgi:malonyl-CoA/methylmalonyl-CoA synthetase
MSPAFPPQELKYIVDQSQASMLLASHKFTSKAESVLEKGLQSNPKLIKVEKRLGGAEYAEVRLEGVSLEGSGGIMLYTSGTTSRPVSIALDSVCTF